MNVAFPASRHLPERVRAFGGFCSENLPEMVFEYETERAWARQVIFRRSAFT